MSPLLVTLQLIVSLIARYHGRWVKLSHESNPVRPCLAGMGAASVTDE